MKNDYFDSSIKINHRYLDNCSIKTKNRYDEQWMTNYRRCHYFIKSNYGNADHCENIYCKKHSNRYEWALLRESPEYTKNIDDYVQLCKKCHSQYDHYSLGFKFKFKKENRYELNRKHHKIEHMTKFMILNREFKKPKQKLTSEERSKILKGRKFSEETKEKMRIAALSRARNIKISEETKEKMRIAARKRIKTIITCPYCGKQGSSFIMKRWHFENCKKRNLTKR